MISDSKIFYFSINVIFINLSFVDLNFVLKIVKHLIFIITRIQTVSLYYNSSVWLDAHDSRCGDRKSADLFFLISEQDVGGSIFFNVVNMVSRRVFERPAE